MASDKHMKETLSKLLKDGETLMYPIFGTIKKGAFHSFAYFAFTETHLLIAYLTSGDKVADIEKLPLDIESVKISKANIFSEYKIHISFENRKSIEISTFPKILKVKAQKDNLPCFLDHLKSRSKKQRSMRRHSAFILFTSTENALERVCLHRVGRAISAEFCIKPTISPTP